jgi:thymidylate kinase
MRPLRVSFSGIDGSGKSTQIELLCRRLSEAGVRCRLLTFWQDIAVLATSRQLLSRVMFRGDQSVGARDRPIERRDKNVTAWYLTLARCVLYCLDAISLKVRVARASAPDADIVIFDRYLYDELANLPSHCLTRTYVRLLAKVVPRPDVAYLLDADPVEARERKPEYPLEFLRRNRKAYLDLGRLVGGMTVVHPLSAEDVAGVVMHHLLGSLPPGDLQGRLATESQVSARDRGQPEPLPAGRPATNR